MRNTNIVIQSHLVWSINPIKCVTSIHVHCQFDCNFEFIFVVDHPSLCDRSRGKDSRFARIIYCWYFRCWFVDDVIELEYIVWRYL